MLQAPFLPEIDIFGEGSNLSLREILWDVCAAVWPGAGPALREHNSVNVLAHQWHHCSYQYRLGRSQHRKDRFTLCTDGEWTHEAKATVKSSSPQISKWFIYVLGCLFFHCMFDWWGVSPWKHGKIAIRRTAFATESEPALSFLFVFFNLSSYRRSQDRQREVPWGLGEGSMSPSILSEFETEEIPGSILR